ncbi:MAG: hypothetical protein NTX79_04840 [Candidatus Micrarchaeota archaeon]|nr:hypothetical protein [Candidatus Micrarchaeota archaeon]
MNEIELEELSRVLQHTRRSKIQVFQPAVGSPVQVRVVDAKVRITKTKRSKGDEVREWEFPIITLTIDQVDGKVPATGTCRFRTASKQLAIEMYPYLNSCKGKTFVLGYKTTGARTKQWKFEPVD